jgi:hypothetical protein
MRVYNCVVTQNVSAARRLIEIYIARTESLPLGYRPSTLVPTREEGRQLVNMFLTVVFFVVCK